MEDYHRQHHSFTTTVHVERCIVPCRGSFAEAKAALEAAVPLLDRTYQRHLDAGDLAAAGEALRMLPTLNRFGAQPRNFGPILRAVATTAGSQTPSDTIFNEALQYEIGNPHKAAQMVRLRGQTALYAPIRVALLQGDVVSSSAHKVEEEAEMAKVTEHRVWFEYDRPNSTMGNTGNQEVDEIARGLDRALHEVLVKAAGLEWKARVGRFSSKI
ncbi:hypothetical protein PG984_010281 [Apiospora sp. TS-2023a]